MRAHGRKAGLHTGQDGQGEVLWPPAARFLCSQSHDASSFHPFLSFPSTKPWFLESCVIFGKENVAVPVDLTLRTAHMGSVSSREELVLNSCAFFSNALLLVMRSRGFYTDTRGKSACGEMQLWETGLKLSRNRPKIFL